MCCKSWLQPATGNRDTSSMLGRTHFTQMIFFFRRYCGVGVLIVALKHKGPRSKSPCSRGCSAFNLPALPCQDGFIFLEISCFSLDTNGSASCTAIHTDETYSLFLLEMLKMWLFNNQWNHIRLAATQKIHPPVAKMLQSFVDKQPAVVKRSRTGAAAVKISVVANLARRSPSCPFLDVL